MRPLLYSDTLSLCMQDKSEPLMRDACTCASVVQRKHCGGNLHACKNCPTTGVNDAATSARRHLNLMRTWCCIPLYLSHNPWEWCDLLRAKTLGPRHPQPASHSRHSEPGCILTRLRVVLHTRGPHNLHGGTDQLAGEQLCSLHTHRGFLSRRILYVMLRAQWANRESR